MKKYVLTMFVIALFAIGFAASGDNDVKVVNGTEYHRVRAKCHNCGADSGQDYWESEKGSTIMDPTLDENFRRGRYYCNYCLSLFYQ